MREKQLFLPLVPLPQVLKSLGFGPISRTIMGVFELLVLHLKWLFNACLQVRLACLVSDQVWEKGSVFFEVLNLLMPLHVGKRKQIV